MAYYQKQLRIKNVTNGFICSKAPYVETFCKDINQVIEFVRNYFTKEEHEKPRRYYGPDKKESE